MQGLAGWHLVVQVTPKQPCQQSGLAVHGGQDASYFIVGLNRWNTFGLRWPVDVGQPSKVY
jgi:hypothetical protein